MSEGVTSAELAEIERLAGEARWHTDNCGGCETTSVGPDAERDCRGHEVIDPWDGAPLALAVPRLVATVRAMEEELRLWTKACFVCKGEPRARECATCATSRAILRAHDGEVGT